MELNAPPCEFLPLPRPPDQPRAGPVPLHHVCLAHCRCDLISITGITYNSTRLLHVMHIVVYDMIPGDSIRPLLAPPRPPLPEPLAPPRSASNPSRCFRFAFSFRLYSASCKVKACVSHRCMSCRPPRQLHCLVLFTLGK